ncbi:MAG: tetratricopeptide repeat protein [Oscillospiraceae bacterium]
MKRAYFMIYLCLLALCLSGCSCAKRTEERWNEQYDVGMQYLLEGDYQEAILAFTATIEIDPMRPESYLERAAAYLELGDDASIEAAVADYQKAVELEPTNGQTYVLLAQTYLRQGNYEQAVNTLHEGQAAASEHAAIDAELKKLQLYVDFNDPHYAPYFLNKTGAELEAAGFVIGYETDYDFYGNGLPIDWIETYGIFLQGLPSMCLNMRGDSSFATAQESWVAYIELVPGEGDEVGILPGISWDLSYEELKEYMGTQLPLYRTEIARYDDSAYTGYYCALEAGDIAENKIVILIFWENIEDKRISEVILFLTENDDGAGLQERLWTEFSTLVVTTASYSLTDANEDYKQKVEEYRNALTMPQDEFERMYWGDYDDASINSYEVYEARVGNYPFFYALYDVDGNGVPELLFSRGNGVIDIYTTIGGVMVKLFPNCSFGYRERLHLLDNGLLLTEGSSSAFSGSFEIMHIDSADGTVEMRDKCCYASLPEYGQDFDSSYRTLREDDYYYRLNKYLERSVYSSIPWTELTL